MYAVTEDNVEDVNETEDVGPEDGLPENDNEEVFSDETTSVDEVNNLGDDMAMTENLDTDMPDYMPDAIL